MKKERDGRGEEVRRIESNQQDRKREQCCQLQVLQVSLPILSSLVVSVGGQ